MSKTQWIVLCMGVASLLEALMLLIADTPLKQTFLPWGYTLLGIIVCALALTVFKPFEPNQG